MSEEKVTPRYLNSLAMHNRRMNNLIQGYIISIDNDLSVGDNTSDVVNVPV